MTDIVAALQFAAGQQATIEGYSRQNAALRDVIAAQGSKIAKLEHESKQLRQNVKRLRAVCDDFHRGDVVPKAIQNTLGTMHGRVTYNELGRLHANQAETIREFQAEAQERARRATAFATVYGTGRLGQGPAIETGEGHH
jgi:uncharacterized protein (DUF3084 family)